ncbi:MAG: GIY-YIG nuclease family protein [Fimbriimonas sp.]
MEKIDQEPQVPRVELERPDHSREVGSADPSAPASAYHLYILESTKSGRFYIGHTASLDDRLFEHNAGRVVATRGKGPWIRVYHESFATRSEAARREREIKSWKSAVMIRNLLTRD